MFFKHQAFSTMILKSINKNIMQQCLISHVKVFLKQQQKGNKQILVNKWKMNENS